ncbi:MAG TPA: potassium-transporting ATPase subunit KdpC [Methylomirabilota bacterium]|nr:potassium-transporting ATPase subunit KdpC [Methylomirabilota bacterium]
MWKELGPAFRVTLLLTIVTGFLYPGVVTGLCQLLFKNAANGSLIYANGHVVGSSLIGQNFTKPQYFQPRPSAAGAGYDGFASGGSNYGPTNQHLIDRVQASINQFHKDNPDYHGPLPADLFTASASGLDPHISPASAEAQAPRVAMARGIKLDQVEQLISRHVEPRQLGFLGEPRINVLELNLDLDHTYPISH